MSKQYKADAQTQRRLQQDSENFARSLNADASVQAFFLRQLEEIDAQNYDVKYANLEAFELVSAKAMDPAKETYTYRQFDKKGVAIMTADYANGAPRAEVDGKEYTARVRSLRSSYGMSIQEMREAASTGTPLETFKAEAARRAINELINTTALTGNAEYSLLGLFNQSAAQTYTVPADGTGASALWTAKTADLILRDMFGIVDQIPTVTKEVEKPNMLLMPYANLRLISTKRLSTSASDTTVLEFFRQQRPGINVRGALLLDTAGSGGTARMVAYNNDPSIVQLLLPIPFEQFPAQQHSLQWTVECHARVGPVICRYPLSMAYGDGI